MNIPAYTNDIVLQVGERERVRVRVTNICSMVFPYL